jgi:dolichol-phosphate mannosyltransferase
MKTLIILPTYNEMENIPKLIPEIFRHVSETADILVVDDNSPDGTGILVQTMADTDRRISILHRAGKMGLGSAYLAGFRRALEKDYDAVIQMDSDFSHPPSALPELLSAAQSSDCVIGSRYVPGGSIEGWPFHRLLLSCWANVYARSILHVPIRDLTGGFRCVKRNVLEAIDWSSIYSEGYAFQIELDYRILRKGFSIREIPIVFKDRVQGRSKLSAGVIWEAVFIVWKLRGGVVSGL